jgi:hypothetical protein
VLLSTDTLPSEGPLPLSLEVDRVEALRILSPDKKPGPLESPRSALECALSERTPNRKETRELGEVALDAVSVGGVDIYCTRVEPSCRIQIVSGIR